MERYFLRLSRIQAPHPQAGKRVKAITCYVVADRNVERNVSRELLLADAEALVGRLNNWLRVGAPVNV